MMEKQAHIVVDFGTGNLRVAVLSTAGELLGVSREDIPYQRDTRYEDSIYFEPSQLWDRILSLTRTALQIAGAVRIAGITATSQREGIVLLDKEGGSLVGMPNIDHRGRDFESLIVDPSRIYHLTGRYPTSLFSAMKMVGLRELQTEWWKKADCMMSISDWVEYMFSGVRHYEHSQASETLVYDIEKKSWSQELLDSFGLDRSMLPPLADSGTVLGNIQPELAAGLGIPPDAKVIVGGADTQLAVYSTRAGAGEMVIVSGTTTPIIKLSSTYDLDGQQRTWTGRYIDENSYMVETNAGVTGLNYQRLKKIFYPNEGYEVIEAELAGLQDFQCVAALGSLVADERKPLIKGGFIFQTPVNHELTRASLVWATLWDIACSIYENYKTLEAVSANDQPFIWTCGGGLQSRLLQQCIADLTGCPVRFRKSYPHASVMGGMMICNQALGMSSGEEDPYDQVLPDPGANHQQHYQRWKETRALLKDIF
ncbi:FGGY-family carbohydrate kinase [Niabella terrae]